MKGLAILQKYLSNICYLALGMLISGVVLGATPVTPKPQVNLTTTLKWYMPMAIALNFCMH
jgi:hypothetical protein